MRKEWGRTIASAVSMLVAGALFAGCAGGGMKLAKVSTVPDTEKNSLAGKMMTHTTAHYLYFAAMTKTGFGIKAQIDRAAMKKVKKVAILAFGLATYSGSNTSSGGGMQFTHTATFKGDWQPFANKAYDQVKTAFEQNGLEVIPVDAVKSNAAYQAFEIKAPAKYTYTAYGLRDFPPVIKYTKSGALMQSKKKAHALECAGKLQELAKSLGVDAVIFVVSDIYIRPAGFFNSLTASIPIAEGGFSGDKGLMVDMFSAEEPKPIWSAALKKEINVPVTSKEKLMEDFMGTYGDVAQIIGLRYKLDREAN